MDKNKYVKLEKCIYKKIDERKYLVDLFIGKNEVGKQIRKSKTCNTLKEARTILKELKREKQSNNSIYIVADITFEKLMEDYIENISKQYNENTTVFSHYNIKDHIFSCFGNRKLSKVNADSLNRYFLLKKKEGLQNSTLKKHYSFLNSVFKYAVYMKSNYGLEKNPMIDVMPIAASGKTNHSYLEPDEILEMKEVLENDSSGLFYPFMLAIFTGMRRGELCALRLDDINLRKNTITINKNRVSMGSIVVNKESTKTHFSRIINISLHLKEILEQIFEENKEKRKIEKDYNSNDFVLVDQKTGKEFNPTLLSMRFMRFIEKHPELKKIKFHELRHSYITNAVALGNVSISDVAKTVGNSKETCLKIYLHASKDAVSKTVKSYDKIFDNYQEVA